MKTLLFTLLLVLLLPHTITDGLYVPTLEEQIEALKPPQDILIVDGPYKTMILRWYGPDDIRKIIHNKGGDVHGRGYKKKTGEGACCGGDRED